MTPSINMGLTILFLRTFFFYWLVSPKSFPTNGSGLTRDPPTWVPVYDQATRVNVNRAGLTGDPPTWVPVYDQATRVNINGYGLT